MSWTITKLADGASGSRDTGGTSFAVAYYLRGDPGASPADTPLDAAGAMAHALTPKLGASYGATFPGAYCVGIDPACLGNGWEWLINCRYSTSGSDSPIVIPADSSVEDIGGGFTDGYDPTDPNNQLEIVVDADGVTQRVSARGADADPRREPWQFEMGSRSMLVERYSMDSVSDAGAVGAAGAPHILTNGRPLGDAFREEVFLPVLQLSKNVPDSYVTPVGAAYLCGSTNSAAINIAGYALAARQALITSLRLRRAWFGDKATKYWEIAVEIAIFDGTQRSDIWVLQQDYYQLDSGLKAITIGGTAAVKPSLLDKDGKLSATPYYKKFARTNIRDWSALKLPRRV